MKKFLFADLHCHPNLKPFGQSFSNSIKIKRKKANLWYCKTPNFWTITLQRLLGITRFSQSDTKSMIDGQVKIAFVSFYPFEKGFFTNSLIPDKISAIFSNFITSIGYERVRYLQKHSNYFKDFLNEYDFIMSCESFKKIKGKEYQYKFIRDLSELEKNLWDDNCLSIIPTIEGAHIFNTGLSEFGRPLDENEVLDNVIKLKQLTHTPLFMTFAHNFNNDLCGHAPSLESLGKLVDQSKNLNTGFTSLGYKVLHALLDNSNGMSIYIDIKHMSLKSRLQYYDIVKSHSLNIPIIVSHGAVTGRSIKGEVSSSLNPNNFANDSINFYDEELIYIAKSKGLFAIQMDAKRLAPISLIKKSVISNNKIKNIRKSAKIVWHQLQHVAEILDQNGLDAWSTCCIGSDFDGTITPLEGVWTTKHLNDLANELVIFANSYLKQSNNLIQGRNKSIAAEDVVSKFTIHNTMSFLKTYYQKEVKQEIITV